MLDQYTIESKILIQPIIPEELLGVVYLGFTSVLNFLYENKSILNTQIIKLGFNSLVHLKFIRDLFIKQAMGKSNLTD